MSYNISKGFMQYLTISFNLFLLYKYMLLNSLNLFYFNYPFMYSSIIESIVVIVFFLLLSPISIFIVENNSPWE
jgi:hypothetical protein